MQSNIVKYQKIYSFKYIEDKEPRNEEQGKLFQKCCGRYCYEKYHPVDDKRVEEIAYQYHVINPRSNSEYNYYKALQLLRSQVICKNKIKCCTYWNCQCIRQRFSKHSL